MYRLLCAFCSANHNAAHPLKVAPKSPRTQAMVGKPFALGSTVSWDVWRPPINIPPGSAWLRLFVEEFGDELFYMEANGCPLPMIASTMLNGTAVCDIHNDRRYL